MATGQAPSKRYAALGAEPPRVTQCGCGREREKWWDEAVEERRGDLEGGGVIVAAAGMRIARRRRLLPGILAVVEGLVRGRRCSIIFESPKGEGILYF